MNKFLNSKDHCVVYLSICKELTNEHRSVQIVREERSEENDAADRKIDKQERHQIRGNLRGSS